MASRWSAGRVVGVAGAVLAASGVWVEEDGVVRVAKEVLVATAAWEAALLWLRVSAQARLPVLLPSAPQAHFDYRHSTPDLR
ncbi:MAG: hypothetical protein A2137_00120 [Chloroflexi bacterium RBG_16_58_8]|nr:MAG: hypothetical protein A2137_00120 [Chloroflexi bacterium RBG_16_58_8]